jgi:hypothetical protein
MDDGAQAAALPPALTGCYPRRGFFKTQGKKPKVNILSWYELCSMTLNGVAPLSRGVYLSDTLGPLGTACEWKRTAAPRLLQLLL